MPSSVIWAVKTLFYFEATVQVLQHGTFYGEGSSAVQSTSEQEDHSLSAIHDNLFNIFAPALNI
jgi:cytochrome b